MPTSFRPSASIPHPTLRWEPASDATGYHLQVATDTDFEDLLLDTVVPPTTTYTLDASLLSRAATTPLLYWRVRAERSDGPAAWTAVHTLTLPRGGESVPFHEGHTSARAALLWIALMIVSFAVTIGLLYWAGAQIS